MKYNKWSSEEEEHLINNWGKVPIKEIANHLNKSNSTVSSKAKRMGLGYSKSWSEEELSYLKDNWGSMRVPSIAKNLERTENAVTVKSKRLKLGSPYEGGEYLSVYQAAAIMNVDYSSIIDNWIPNHDFPVKKRRMRQKAKNMVFMDDLIKWIECNQGLWDSRRIKKYALGIEPEWLSIKRENDSEKPKRSGRLWTKEEDGVAIVMFKRGVTKVKIGERLGRSRMSVQHRLGRLDVWGTGEVKKDVIEKGDNDYGENNYSTGRQS